MNIETNKIQDSVLQKYTISKNTFSASIKNYKKDSVYVEIGDAKQNSFYPQIKLMRWDNEVNFSMRLVDELPIIDVFTEANVIGWYTENKIVKVYEVLKGTSIYDEGSYEFEITLLSKPKINKIEFTISHKNIEFLYQPPVSKYEYVPGVLDIIIRPPHVVGSYALYYKNPPFTTSKGKWYGMGKAFHIYRPKITDSRGISVWGELDIDEVNNKLYVTIPQEFLDEAVYPVFHAAGATIGYPTIGATEGASTTPTAVMSRSNTDDFGGDSNFIYFYCKKINGNIPMVGALYDLTNLLSPQAPEITVSNSTYQWVSIPFTPTKPTLPASTLCGATVGYNCSVSDPIYFMYDSGGTTPNRYQTMTYPYWKFFVANYMLTTNRYSLYASYGQVFNSIYAINNIGADEIGSINNLEITDIKEVNGVD
jgi:hypothetical protein